MKNSHLTDEPQNHSDKPKRPQLPTGYKKPKTASTQHRKVLSKNKVLLSSLQYDALAMLLKDYGIQRPTWLYQRFIVNQRRRKFLNTVLWEAGCNLDICARVTPSDDWAYALHVVSHLINDESLCNGRKIP